MSGNRNRFKESTPLVQEKKSWLASCCAFFSCDTKEASEEKHEVSDEKAIAAKLKVLDTRVDAEELKRRQKAVAAGSEELARQAEKNSERHRAWQRQNRIR